MKEVAQLVYQTLTQNSQFSAEMGSKCFPLFAKEGTDFPFSVYNIGEVLFVSKESRMFPVTVSLCYPPEKYTEAIDFSDVVKDIFEGLPNCDFLSTSPSYDTESQIIVININLQITK